MAGHVPTKCEVTQLANRLILARLIELTGDVTRAREILRK